MKKPSWKSQGPRSKLLRSPRPIDESALAEASGAADPVPPPSTWVPEQHNETLVRDRRRRARR